MSSGKSDDGLRFDQILNEVVEKVVEAIVVHHTVVAEFERPDQRVLRLLEDPVVGDAPLARAKLVNLAPKAVQGSEVVREVVLVRVVFEASEGWVDRDGVEARVAAVERLDHVPGRTWCRPRGLRRSPLWCRNPGADARAVGGKT